MRAIPEPERRCILAELGRDALGLARHEKGRHAALRLGQDHEDLGGGRGGDERFLAFERPALSRAYGLGVEVVHVAPVTGLGHGERRQEPLGKARQKALLHGIGRVKLERLLGEVDRDQARAHGGARVRNLLEDRDVVPEGALLAAERPRERDGVVPFARERLHDDLGVDVFTVDLVRRRRDRLGDECAQARHECRVDLRLPEFHARESSIWSSLVSVAYLRGGRRLSSSMLNSRTLTRGSPSTPSVRGSVFLATRSRKRSSSIPRAWAIRGNCQRAASGERCGVEPAARRRQQEERDLAGRVGIRRLEAVALGQDPRDGVRADRAQVGSARRRRVVAAPRGRGSRPEIFGLRERLPDQRGALGAGPSGRKGGCRGIGRGRRAAPRRGLPAGKGRLSRA